MRLSKNFTLREFTRSQTATRLEIDNTPSNKSIEALKKLCYNCLQPIRDHYGRSVRISSGYRSPELNTRIGGSETSSHCYGEAADFEISGIDNYSLAEWCKNNLEFDQLILEFPGEHENDGWIHISYVSESENRNMVMTAYKEEGKTVYELGLLEYEDIVSKTTNS